MSDDLPLPSGFEGTVRLFPLPNVVLFPQVVVPLHVFEQRYRRMTADALAKDKLIALVLLQPGWESDYEGRPPVHEVACVGRIVTEQLLEDGRYNLLLRGLSRVRLMRELKTKKPYRLARVELLSDPPAIVPQMTPDQRADLGARITAWLSKMGQVPDQVAKLLESKMAVGSLADILAFALPLDLEFKQQLLEELIPERRLRRLVEHLEKNEPPPHRKFPPEFSSN
jgi:Lon protease-like protein